MKKTVVRNGLSARFLREIAKEIMAALTKSFNKSLKICVFPSD